MDNFSIIIAISIVIILLIVIKLGDFFNEGYKAPPTLGPLVENTYTFYPGKAIKRSNIYKYREHKNNITALKDKCNRLVKCKGFNSVGGALKKRIPPQSKWRTIRKIGPTIGVYVKNTSAKTRARSKSSRAKSKSSRAKSQTTRDPPETKSQPNYKFYSGKNILGNNIYRFENYKNNISALKAECSKRSKCKAFNTGGSLKDKVPSMKEWRIMHNSNDSARGVYIKLLPEGNEIPPNTTFTNKKETSKTEEPPESKSQKTISDPLFASTGIIRGPPGFGGPGTSIVMNNDNWKYWTKTSGDGMDGILSRWKSLKDCAQKCKNMKDCRAFEINSYGNINPNKSYFCHIPLNARKYNSRIRRGTRCGGPCGDSFYLQDIKPKRT